MSSDRYFKNPFEDYDASKDPVLVDKELLQQLVQEYVTKTLKETKKAAAKPREDLYVGDAGKPGKIILTSNC